MPDVEEWLAGIDDALGMKVVHVLALERDPVLVPAAFAIGPVAVPLPWEEYEEKGAFELNGARSLCFKCSMALGYEKYLVFGKRSAAFPLEIVVGRMLARWILLVGGYGREASSQNI